MIEKLNIKIFADGADKNNMLDMYNRNYIKGLTTNPTLMRKAGIKNYEKFCKDILLEIREKPISFEVFSDDFDEMEKQALKINSWGENIYVKIPITNTKGEVSYDLIKKLSHLNIKLNITALMTIDQVKNTLDCLKPEVPNFISVFAGRIADTGRDPVPIMKECINLIKSFPKTELIWASPRELLNICQANDIGCHIITATPDILNKITLIGKDLEEYSLETVKMFYDDALKANYKI